MSTHATRSFEAPAALVAAGYGPTADLDELDREVEFPGAYGDWAEKVLFAENTKTLTEICGSMRLLPRGILSSVQLDDGSLLIDGLVDSDGRVWDQSFNAWGTPTDEVDIVDGTVALDDDEVAFVARALREGADECWFRPFVPKAFVSAIVAAPAPPQDRLGRKSKVPEIPQEAQEVPSGSAIIAVVDPIDEDAVLEMLAITPGPHVLRRHDGQWFDDPAWVSVLKSVKPPKIVKLTTAQVASVTAQVDRSTNDQDFEPFDVDSREQYQIFTASAYVRELQCESDEKALFALVAVAGRELSPKDAANTERLKRYWTVGKGAAKIKWMTPGSFSRCQRHLRKYMPNPEMVNGYCMSLCQRLGGSGVACRIGTEAKDKIVGAADDGLTSEQEGLTAANPTGVNAYDKGASFEEATGGVERDYSGRFAPESGGSARSARRSKSLKDRSDWYEGKSKFKILPNEKEQKKAEADQKRAEAARKKAEREAQREQLAQIALSISEASAAGNTTKAAELRVQQAELRLSFATTNVDKLNAQTALNNARAALARSRVAKSRKNGAASGQSAANNEAALREKERVDGLMKEFDEKFDTPRGTSDTVR